MDTKLWKENVEERNHLGDLAIDGRILVKKYRMRIWIRFTWLRI
jgi:hypothetical protein